MCLSVVTLGEADSDAILLFANCVWINGRNEAVTMSLH